MTKKYGGDKCLSWDNYVLHKLFKCLGLTLPKNQSLTIMIIFNKENTEEVEHLTSHIIDDY